MFTVLLGWHSSLRCPLSAKSKQISPTPRPAGASLCEPALWVLWVLPTVQRKAGCCRLTRNSKLPHGLQLSVSSVYTRQFSRGIFFCCTFVSFLEEFFEYSVLLLQFLGYFSVYYFHQIQKYKDRGCCMFKRLSSPLRHTCYLELYIEQCFEYLVEH